MYFHKGNSIYFDMVFPLYDECKITRFLSGVQESFNAYSYKILAITTMRVLSPRAHCYTCMYQ
jgi:hypothetical protein